jgi:hypothetical protein
LPQAQRRIGEKSQARWFEFEALGYLHIGGVLVKFLTWLTPQRAEEEKLPGCLPKCACAAMNGSAPA